MEPTDEARELLELLDEGRAGERSSARGRERRLRQQAEEGARLAGTLLDLAERGSAVTVRTVAGTARHGPVLGVGADFVVVRDRGIDAHVRLAALTSVRPHPGERHPAASGDRPPPLDVRLVEVLARLAGERPRVSLVTSPGEVVSGELRAVGDDVVTVRLDGDPPGLCYVASASLAEVLLRSG